MGQRHAPLSPLSNGHLTEGLFFPLSSLRVPEEIKPGLFPFLETIVPPFCQLEAFLGLSRKPPLLWADESELFFLFPFSFSPPRGDTSPSLFCSYERTPPPRLLKTYVLFSLHPSLPAPLKCFFLPLPTRETVFFSFPLGTPRK